MKRKRSTWIVLLGLILMLALVPILTVQADYGFNWTATFFPTKNPSGTGTTVTLPNGINFQWGLGPPNVNGVNVLGSQADGFSVRFTSIQNIAPGVYNFVAVSDDGIRVNINGVTVLDKFVPRVSTTDTFTYTVTTNPVNITVEYFDEVADATVQFQWFLVGGGGTPVGTPFFGTPFPQSTAVPALTVSVKSVKGLAIRTGPYLGASLIGVLRPGTQYPPLARNKDEGIYTWFLVKTDTQQGWVSGRYLEVVGDINTAPLQSTIFEQIDGAPTIGVLAVPRSVMNLRKRPSQRTQVLTQVPWGAETELLNRTIQGGNNFWLQVRYEGQVGWIYAPFVSIRGDVNAVPIR
jgi:uncharacterized protein YraI